MLRYHDIANDERRVLSLTSLTPQEFTDLVPLFTTSFYEYLDEQTVEGYERVGRRYVPYRNSTLPTMEDKLLFILVYLKQAPTQEVQAGLFGMRQPKANMWIHLLHPVLHRALKQNGDLPNRNILIKLAESRAKEKETVTEASATDGPGDPDEQKWYYSGKKRQHTIKNIVVIDNTVRVRCLGATWEGTCHDKRAADSETYHLPAGSTLYQDMGFQGFAVDGVVVIQPKKKPRGGTLTAEEKEENSRINSIRVRIEHAISGIKRCRIVKDKLRLWREHIHDMVMETCCGLHNYRLRYRPWTYPDSNQSG